MMNHPLLEGSMPQWAQNLGLKDFRSLLAWDTDMYIALVGINGHLIDAICNTGGGHLLIDIDTARKLKFEWTLVKGNEFGTYSVAGELQPKAYYGITKPTVIIFDE